MFICTFETNISHTNDQNRQLITSFVGLWEKSYSLMMVDEEGNTSRKLAAAGVKSCIAKKHSSHQDYVDCVQQPPTSRGLRNILL